MAEHVFVGSASSSLTDSRRDLGTSVDKKVKWESLKTFLYLASTFASAKINFGIFSGIFEGVPMWLHIFLVVFVGMPYMCMDLFIKMYTGKIDLNESMIPLLKAVNSAIMLQSGLWSLVDACDLSDSVLNLMACMMGIPPWLDCQIADGETCVPIMNISVTCKKGKIPEKQSSHYLYYRKMFLLGDKSIVTRRIFFIALVWIVNFFITTLSEPMLTKFFKLSFIFRLSLSLFFVIYVGMLSRENLLPAFKDMISQQDYDLVTNIGHVMYTFGIGLVGVYDFGAMSPFTTVDTATVLFTIMFTGLAFLRSLIVRILYNFVYQCVDIKNLDYHYVFMSIVPLGSMFVKLQRLIMILIFLIMITTVCPHIAAVTYTMAKILHSEFHSVKNVYFTGLLSFFGFLLTSVLALYIHFPWLADGIRKALFTTMVFLGFMRIAIIMYIYGVQKFCSDIHFWLGFKPALYWIVTWSLMPAILLYGAAVAFLHLIEPFERTTNLLWRSWVGFSLLLVLIVALKTVARYASRNKLLSVLRPSTKYGPPDAEERKRRKRYDESVTVRQCVHNCVPLDDRFDCNHIPRKYGGAMVETMELESVTSMNPIFEAEALRKSRQSSMFDAHQMRD